MGFFDDFGGGFNDDQDPLDEIFNTPSPSPIKLQGLISPGNIDLNKRPIVKNPDGSISTVRSMSTNIDGKETLLPTISDDGRNLTDEEAIDSFKKSGKHLGMFATVNDATKYAQQLHEDQAKQYAPPPTDNSLDEIFGSKSKREAPLVTVEPGLLGRVSNLVSKYSQPFEWTKKGDKLAEQAQAGQSPIPEGLEGIPILGPVAAIMRNKYTAGPANELEKSVVGNPLGLASTLATAGASMELPLAAGAARALSGAGAVAAVPELTENISKGNYWQAAGNAAQVGLGALGARKAPNFASSKVTNPLIDLTEARPNEINGVALLTGERARNLFKMEPGEAVDAGLLARDTSNGATGYRILSPDAVHPQARVDSNTPFIVTNPTPRNLQYLEEQGQRVGDVLPINPRTGASPGRLVNSIDTVLPEGEAPTSLGRIKLGDQAKTPQQAISNWLGDRRAAPVEATKVGQQFSKYDRGGVDNLIEYNRDPNEFPDVKKYFDEKYAQVRSSGKKFGYKENYLPQLWEDSADKVNEVFGKRLSTKSKFEFNSVVKDYQTGIDQGLTPKYKTIGELASWYEHTANTAMADRTFFENLRKSGTITARPTKTNTTLLSPDTFPVRYIKDKKKGKEIIANYYAPKDLATQINNYLKPASEGPIQKIADFTSNLKGFRLAAGVPNTGINIHGFNIAARNALASNNPVSAYAKGIGYLVNPGAASKFVDANLDKAVKWARAGIDLGVEDVGFRAQKPMSRFDVESISDIGKWVLSKQQHYFEHPLFQQVMPALKIQKAQELLPQYVEKFGEKAPEEVAKAVNTIFGGRQLDALTRNKDTQNLLRILLLAPSWLESNKDIAVGTAKALLNPSDPKGMVYQKMARNLALAYMSASVTNKGASGHWMHENEAGKSFAIDTGQKDSKGKIVYANPFGTSVDYVRLAIDAAKSASTGDIQGITQLATNRLSSTAQLGKTLLTGQNWKRQNIYDRSNPAKTLANVGREGLEMLPPFVSSPVDYAFDKISGPEAFTNSFELPMGYRKPYDPNPGIVKPIY